MDSEAIVKAFEKINPFLAEQRAIEEEVLKFAGKFLPSGMLVRPKVAGDELSYLRTNVFSILFLAVYECVGIDERRRRFYGSLNQCIRGVVTATDNILDNEDKDLLPLPLPKGANRFRSVMSALIYDRIIDALCDDFGAEKKPAFQRELTSALYQIGEVEAEEEVGLKKVASPSEIVRRVHNRRGGNLLKLAFIAPQVYETAGRDRLDKAAEGIHSIGMALQMVDDIVDLAEDARSMKNNYLLSRMLSEKFGHGIALGGWKALAEVRPKIVAEAVDSAVDEALGGFRQLEAIGFGLTPEGAMRFIATLFDLRGGAELLALARK